MSKYGKQPTQQQQQQQSSAAAAKTSHSKKDTPTDRVIRFKCSLQNTILDVLRARGWQEVVGEGDWDFYWCDVGWMKEYFDHYYLEEHMKLCHFRNHYELTRKNLMVKNLKRYRKQVEREHGKMEAQKCDFFPMTFELPTEYHMFVEEFKKSPGQIWIMKPVAKSQGKGIFLFRKLKDIVDWKKSPQADYQPMVEGSKEPPENYVVQRYVDEPYLIGGRKFDLRVYILVTSYVPLKAWLYREGFARLSNTRFSLDTIDDTYVHLTNVAVQKTAPDYDPEKGSKWSVRQMRIFLNARHGTQLVNASPSLTASSQEDHDLKSRLLDDVLNVIDLENRLTGKEKGIGGFDLIWDDGPVYADCTVVEQPDTPQLNSFLGCMNDRTKQLRTMYRIIQLSKKAAVPIATAATTAATAGSANITSGSS